MFRIAADNANRIESDDGFSVEILGRGGLCYSEAGHEMRVDSEFLALGSRFDMVVYGGSVRRWKPPYSEETIDSAKRALILDNIRRALESRGLRIDMDT